MGIFNLKSLFLLLTALVTIAGVTACQGEEAVEAPVPETAAPAEETTDAEASPDAEAVGAAAEEGVIVPAFSFTNTGEEEICELYLSAVDQEEWGPDQLGEDTIPPGEEYILQEIPAGDYDLKAIGCEGSEIIDTLSIQPE